MKQHTQVCPIAATTNILGDHWTLLILREAFRGATRFKEFQTRTGAAKTVLSDRLSRLIQSGIFEMVDIGENGYRAAYALTTKGRSLSTVMIAIHQWGNAHLFGEGKEPVLLVDRATGAVLPTMTPHSASGKALQPEEIAMVSGPARGD